MTQASLIFDLDGTLVDSREDLADAVNEFRSRRSLPPLPLEQIVGYIGDGATILLRRSLTDAPEIDPIASGDEFRAIYRKHLTLKTVLYPGVETGLRRLHAAGFKLAMFSNKPQSACIEILQHFQIAPLFTHIVGGGGGFPLKPAPDAILRILSDNQSEPASSWMIGDHHTDIRAGQNANIRTALVTYGFGTPDELIPDLTVNTFDSLVKHFWK